MTDMHRLAGGELDDTLRQFLAEDIGRSDITTERTVPEDAMARGELLAKSECVVSGLHVARRVDELLDGDLEWDE